MLAAVKIHSADQCLSGLEQVTSLQQCACVMHDLVVVFCSFSIFQAFVPLNAAILYIFVVIFFSFFRADLRRRQLDKCDAMSLASPPGRTGMGYGTSAGTGYGTDEQGPPWSPDKGTPAPEDF